MTIRAYASCEPLRLWNRLETRVREVGFERALRAEVHDPLWLLGRQWQFGELKGEDTGSPVTVRLTHRSAPLREISLRSSTPEPYSSSAPLESTVERVLVAPDPAFRAQAGRVLFMMVRSVLEEAVSPAVEAMRAALLKVFALARDPAPPNAGAGAWRSARTKEVWLRACIGATAIDGHAAFVALDAAAQPGGDLSWSDLPAPLALPLAPEHGDLVLAAFRRFREWYAKCRPLPAPAEPVGSPPKSPAWDESRLEYRFKAALCRDEARVELEVPEHVGGRLDWYAFDVADVAEDTASPAVAWTPITVLPAPAEFAGMPHPRYWQLEDGAVDLGNLRADTTDVAKIVVAEFALVYGNDWSIIPLQLERGGLAELQGIVVTDVFGQRTFVRSANDSTTNAWSKWDFFSLCAPKGSAPPLGQHLFLPPVVAETTEGEPIEQVAFLRDETANLVWGIEQRLSDGVGGSLDGHDAARRVARALRTTGSPGAAADVHRYVLGTTVPENWIPFVPVHQPDDTRGIRLQRAAMPRFTPDSDAGGQAEPIRPRSDVLRTGIGADDKPTAPYFVNEEEVPRGGIVVDASWQRARWHDGSTFVWLGRSKRSGAGEGGSGLRFDVLLEPKGS